MKKSLMLVFVGLAAQLALAVATATADETPAAEASATQADPQSTAAAPTAAKAETQSAAAAQPAAKEFKPPPGFYTKTRGALKVYCKKDREIGTRFVTEKCMTEDQVHQYLLALETQKQDVDRIRNACGGGPACASQ